MYINIYNKNIHVYICPPDAQQDVKCEGSIANSSVYVMLYCHHIYIYCLQLTKQ